MGSASFRGSIVVAVSGIACGAANHDARTERSVGPRATVASTSAASVGAPASPPTQGLPSSYVALFDDLVAKIERNHVFAERAKGPWPENKKRLRAEMEKVTTREQALVALYHLQMALGDRHCWIAPPNDIRSKRLSLGVTLFAEAIPGGTRVRVDEVLDHDLEKAGTVQEGDEVVAVDGVSPSAWIDANPFVSNSLNPEVALAERVATMVRVTRPWTDVADGARRTLRLRRAGVERDVALRFVHPSQWEDVDEPDFDDAPAMASIGCRVDEHRPYTDFELAAVGANVCVYAPKNGRRDTRLVRFISFNYGATVASEDGLRMARADHVLLTRELKNAKAVILDVNENRGGNNPFVFLSWFAKTPWDHETVHVRVAPEMNEDEIRQFLFGDTTLVARYREAAKSGLSEVTWPFLCSEGGKPVLTGTCEARGPRPSERVTEAPVALVTGPACTSSCDGIASGFAAFDMGPVVGKQPAHGFTTVRHTYPLVGPDGRDLGVFRIALSWEAYPRVGTPLEGEPIALDWEAPTTFETRRTWVDLSVKEARRLAEGTGSARPKNGVAARP